MGQTSGEWVLIQTFHFAAKTKARVTVYGEDAKGTVMADAILLHYNQPTKQDGE